MSAHDEFDFHKTSVSRASEFCSVILKKQKPVIEQVNSQLTERIKQNRQKLASILKTVIFCGMQNIALRGHRDNSTAPEEGNRGNFHALLMLRVDAGDDILKDHLEKCGKNAIDTSKTVQNELISLVGGAIKEVIVRKVAVNKVFSVIADEATDSSNKEQLPLVIRFVDSDNNIREEFVGFQECVEGISGEAVADLILSAVGDLGLDMEHCRGQCYDGAGNMAGKCKGAASRITAKHKLALYVHCSSHRLNLCVVKACQVQAIRNMMSTLGEVTRFFNVSPKRQMLLDRTIQEECPESSYGKLTDVCRTWWVERLDALDIFSELISAVVVALEHIKDNQGVKWNGDSTRDANGLYHSIMTFPFLMSFAVIKEVQAYTRGLTVRLQKVSLDSMEAYQDAFMMFSMLKKICNEDIEVKTKEWFEKAMKLAKDLQV